MRTLAAALLAACAGSRSLVGAGQECLLAADCEVGLVCVPGKDGRRVCSRDLSGVTKPYDAGGAADATADASRPQDGGPQDATFTDTGAPDSGIDAPVLDAPPG